MKIVMEYSEHGDFGCGCYEHVLCFEYESKEAFILDFEICLNEVNLNRFNYLKASNEWAAKKPPFERHNQDPYKEWNAKRPQKPKDAWFFTICGHMFNYEDFLPFQEEYLFRIKENEQFELPEVYESDEWWETKRLN